MKYFLLIALALSLPATAVADSPIVAVPRITSHGNDSVEAQRFGRRPEEPTQPPQAPSEAPKFVFPSDPVAATEDASESGGDRAAGIADILRLIFGGNGEGGGLFSDMDTEDWAALIDRIMVIVTALMGIFGGMSAGKRGGILRFLERRLLS